MIDRDVNLKFEYVSFPIGRYMSAFLSKSSCHHDPEIQCSGVP